jgi:hypothetical protein
VVAVEAVGVVLLVARVARAAVVLDRLPLVLLEQRTLVVAVVAAMVLLRILVPVDQA